LNLSVNVAALLYANCYPVLLFPFAFFSLLFLKNHPLLRVPLLWFSAVFAFYLPFWLSMQTPVVLYQLMAMPAFSVFSGFGLFAFFDFLAKNKRFPNPPKSIPLNKAVFFVSLLVVIVSFMPTGLFSIHGIKMLEENYCIYDDILSIPSITGRDACIVASDATFSLGTSAFHLASYSLPGMEIKKMPFLCHASERFFFDLNAERIPPFVMPEENPTKLFIENNCSMRLVERKEKFDLYKINCSN